LRALLVQRRIERRLALPVRGVVAVLEAARAHLRVALAGACGLRRGVERGARLRVRGAGGREVVRALKRLQGARRLRGERAVDGAGVAAELLELRLDLLHLFLRLRREDR